MKDCTSIRSSQQYDGRLWREGDFKSSPHFVRSRQLCRRRLSEMDGGVEFARLGGGNLRLPIIMPA